MKYTIEQDFEVLNENQTVSVRSNEPFLTEMIYCIKVAIKNFLLVIDTNTEMNERKESLGYFCLYALYRRLILRKVQPEEKVLNLLWKLQKQLPCIITFQNSIWNLGTRSFYSNLLIFF